MQLRTESLYSDTLTTLLAGEPFSTHVRGQCMAPLIPDGSMISVEPGGRLRCGDVMVWRDGAGRFVCHRYLGRFPRRQGFGAISWADNEQRPDGLLPDAAILGKVLEVDGERLRIGRRARWRSRLQYLGYCSFRLRKMLA